MKSSTLQRQKEMSIPELQKRIKTLEAQIDAMTVPKKEEPLPEITEEWLKKAVESITHITVLDICSKCNHSITYNQVCGQWKHKVTCGKCGHTEDKTMF